MFTKRAVTITLLLVAVGILSFSVYNQVAHAWANEYIEITVHTGHWYCGSYCGSTTTVSTYVNTNAHFVTYHTGAGADGHNDGHGSSIVYRRTDVVKYTRWDITCSGDECNAA